MRIEIDWALCEANGACAIEAPDVFDINEDDDLVVDETADVSAQRERVTAAARACPKRAIILHD